MKDEHGQYAVFTEQGASASHMAASVFLDALARMPGNDGQDDDAIGAYTQIPLKEAERLLGYGIMPETWVTIPKNRWPKEWWDLPYGDPVVPLELNLYGHPLAGLLWEKGCAERLQKEGFERVIGWECLYVHRKEKCFYRSTLMT